MSLETDKDSPTQKLHAQIERLVRTEVLNSNLDVSPLNPRNYTEIAEAF